MLLHKTGLGWVVALVLLISFGVAHAPLQAETLDRKIGDWSLRCRSSGANTPRECAIIQTVRSVHSSDHFVAAIIGQTEDRALALKLIAPKGVELASGATLLIDGQHEVTVPFSKCDDSGCFGETVLAGTFAGRFGAAKSAAVYLRTSEKEGFSLPLNPTSFDLAVQQMYAVTGRNTLLLSHLMRDFRAYRIVAGPTQLSDPCGKGFTIIIRYQPEDDKPPKDDLRQVVQFVRACEPQDLSIVPVAIDKENSAASRDTALVQAFDQRNLAYDLIKSSGHIALVKVGDPVTGKEVTWSTTNPIEQVRSVQQPKVMFVNLGDLGRKE